jgi:hypothetical protein
LLNIKAKFKVNQKLKNLAPGTEKENFLTRLVKDGNFKQDTIFLSKILNTMQCQQITFFIANNIHKDTTRLYDWLISVQLIPNSSAIFCNHSAIF